MYYNAKNKSMLFLILSLCVLNSFIIPNYIEFIGYLKEKPVFNAYREKSIYKLESDSFVLHSYYLKNYDLLSINDFYALFMEQVGNTKRYAIVNLQTQLVENVEGDDLSIYCSIDDQGCVFYSSKTDENPLGPKVKSPNFALGDNLFGYVKYCDSNYIYYAVQNEEEIGPDETVCRYDKKLKKVEAFCNNTSSDSFMFFKGVNMFYIDKLYGGGFHPILYDIKKRKIIYFDKDTLEVVEKARDIFFDPSKRALCGIINGKIKVLYRVE